MKTLFGTDGIRGRANTYPITAELALKLARALPRVLAIGPHANVLIARDTRISGRMLESALQAGLLAEGLEVLIAGPVPTPAAALLTKTRHCAAGIMLTASHNPFEDNGIKIFGPDGYKLSDAQETALETLLLSDDFSPAAEGGEVGALTILPDAAASYVDFALQSFGDRSLTGLALVIDAANGAGYEAAPLLFEKLGAKVVTLGATPNGRNINHEVGSLHPEAAAALVKEHNADLAICLDGDADRLAVVDATGEIVDGDKLLCLCALGLHAAGKLAKSTVVATVMSNLGLKEALADKGIALETTAVGDRNVLERMRSGGFNFGGENSGHLIFSDYATTGDGIMAALQVLAEMKDTGKSLAELADCMTLFPQKLVNLAVREKPPLDEIAGLPQLIRDAETDLGDSGRVLIRYSGTEKKIRVMVEARDEGQVDEWVTKFVDLLQSEIGA